MTTRKSTKSPKNFLSNEAIAAAVDTPTVDIEVPEWGGWVKLRPLTLGELNQITADVTSEEGEPDPELTDLYCLAASFVEPAYDRESIMALKQKNATVVNNLVGKMVLLQGGGAGALERYEKSLLEK